jgi:hypothetical protein
MGNTNQVVRYFYDKVIGGSKLGNKKASSKGSVRVVVTTLFRLELSENFPEYKIIRNI